MKYISVSLIIATLFSFNILLQIGIDDFSLPNNLINQIKMKLNISRS